MKVETFSGMTEASLSKKVNQFLEDNSVEVVDIKLSSSVFYLSAMLIFKY